MVRRDVRERCAAARVGATRRRRRVLSGLLLAATLAAAACGGDDGGASTTAASTTPAGVTTTTIAIAGDATTLAPAADATTVAPATTLEPSTTVAEAPEITDAAVTRSDDGGELTVQWTGGSDATTLSWGTSPDAIDQPVDGPIESGSVTLADPAPGARAFFRIVDGDAGVTVAERRVVLEGAPNFRDLGGYETADGRHVKWGQVYRSGALADLTDADLAVVDAIGLQLVCDLRSSTEVSDEPDPEGVAAQQIRIDVNGDDDTTAAVIAAIGAGDLESLSPNMLLDGMPSISLDFPEQWADLLSRVADPANRPTNFHCTGGKDRAGWGSALILRALGVPEETVMQDYLLSNDYLAAGNQAAVDQVRTIVAGVNGVPEDQVDVSNLVALLEVRPEYLQASFDAVDAKFGSFDGYLTDGLGLSEAQITALRDSMLE